MIRTVFFVGILCLFSLKTEAIIRYVTPSGNGVQNALSWANAINGGQLQNVINAALPGDEIWVAQGTYLTTNTTNRTIAFRMRNNIRIYGSFLGNETSLSQRNLGNGITSILSGEIGGTTTADNSYHVVSNVVGTDTTAWLDGFRIRGANDNRSPTILNGLGGGVYNNGGYSGNFCNPTFRNCVITDNQAQFGAGMFNSGHSGGVANPIVINCVIAYNTAYLGGGGIDNFGLAGNASPILTNVIVYGNTAIERAGGMYCWGGNNGNANPVMINCSFVNNTAQDGGGLVSDIENSPAGSFSGNSQPTFINSILWGNTCTGTGPQFFRKGANSSMFVSYSNINLTNQTGLHTLTGSTTGNLYTDPFFVNPLSAPGPDNLWLTSDDGLQLQPTSPLLQAGTITLAPLTDVLQRNRIGLPDIGAYEYVASDIAIQCYLQGYYDGGAMRNVLFNQNQEALPSARVDSIQIDLVHPTTLTTEFTQIQTIDTNGWISLHFPQGVQGNSYYLRLLHRNTMETWSAAPVLMHPTTSYLFSGSAAQAYGNNQIQVNSGVWALYSGDSNQDDAIDAFDYVELDTDIILGSSGYLATDITGDGTVDAFDYILFDANLIAGISANTP
jgi:hypothetical protein